MPTRRPNRRSDVTDVGKIIHQWPHDRTRRVDLALVDFQAALALEALHHKAGQRVPDSVLQMAERAVDQLEADGIPPSYWDTALHAGEVIV